MPEKIKKQKAKFSEKLSAKDYALYLLSIRLRASGDLAFALAKKGYPQTEISEAIRRLTDLAFLNDQQFAQIYLDNLVKYKSFGYFGIKKKLVEKRLDSKLVERLLRGFTAAEEQALARRVAARYPRKTPEQLGRFLQSKGFRGEAIFKVAKIGLHDD